MSKTPTQTDGAGAARSTLTRRASLNALAAIVDYGARTVIYLILAPLLLRFLGVAGYGTWQVLQRLIGHTAPANGRPGEALKWIVAHAQQSTDLQRKRMQVGTAIAVWALFLPLVAVLGGVLVWISPSLVDAQGEEAWLVRVTAGLLVLNVIVLGLASIPQSVLQGENLGYRRLGVSTAVLCIGGVLTAFALYAGWGMPGVAAAMVLTTILSGATFLHIVRRHVTWWGLAKPDFLAVKGFVGLSGWFLLWNFVMHAIKGSDVIVLAAVGGVAMVTTYTLTSYVPHAVGDVVFLIVSATMPGLGGLVGAGELPRAASIRAETMLLTWMVGIGSAATVIMWLPMFLGLWVGRQYDAGATATVLICLMMVQLTLIRVDSNVIDLTLRIRAKVLLGLVSVALSAGTALALMANTSLGIVALLVGFMLGRLPLTVAYPVLVGRMMAIPLWTQVASLWRPGLTSMAVLVAAAWLRLHTPDVGWLPLIMLAALTTAVSLLAIYLLGLSRAQRRRVRYRVLKVVRLR